MKYSVALLLALCSLTAASVLRRQEDGLSTRYQHIDDYDKNNNDYYNDNSDRDYDYYNNKIVDRMTRKVDSRLVDKQQTVLHLLSNLEQDTLPVHLSLLGKTFKPHEHLDKFQNRFVVKMFLKGYANNLLLPKNEVFSPTIQQHQNQAALLFHFLYSAENWETMKQAAVWARIRLNAQQFAYAFTAAVLNHPTTRGVVLPALYEVVPHAFIPANALHKIYKAKMMGHKFVTVYANYTNQNRNNANYMNSLDLLDEKNNYYGSHNPNSVFADNDGSLRNMAGVPENIENRMSYFTEDIGINAFHSGFHVQNPAFLGMHMKYGVESGLMGDMLYTKTDEMSGEWNGKWSDEDMSDEMMDRYNKHRRHNDCKHNRNCDDDNTWNNDDNIEHQKSWDMDKSMERDDKSWEMKNHHKRRCHDDNCDDNDNIWDHESKFDTTTIPRRDFDHNRRNKHDCKGKDNCHGHDWDNVDHETTYNDLDINKKHRMDNDDWNNDMDNENMSNEMKYRKNKCNKRNCDDNNYDWNNKHNMDSGEMNTSDETMKMDKNRHDIDWNRQRKHRRHNDNDWDNNDWNNKDQDWDHHDWINATTDGMFYTRPFLNVNKYTKEAILRGEAFYYAHHQLYARYVLERLSNDLPIPHPINFEGKIKVGYNPNLRHTNGIVVPARPPNTWFNQEIIEDNNNNNALLSYNLQAENPQVYEKRLMDVAESGIVMNEDGTKTKLTYENGIGILANLVAAPADSPNPYFYGDYFNTAKYAIGNIVDPNKMNGVGPGPVANLATAARDPAYYQLLAKLNKIFFNLQNNLGPYSQRQLLFSGIKIEDFDVSRLVTYFDISKVNVNHAIGSDLHMDMTSDNYIIKFQRLNNKPFDYKLKIYSDKSTDAVVRVFIGPKYDSNGQLFTLPQASQYFVQLDQFRARLQNGQNIVKRNSKQSPNYVSDPPTFQELWKRVESSKQGDKMMYFDETESRHCGFPQRAQLPKGKINGQEFVFYAIVTEADKSINDLSLGKDRLFQSFYCGGNNYIQTHDRKSIGFPFDRPILDALYNTPNQYFKTVNIYHKNDIYDQEM